MQLVYILLSLIALNVVVFIHELGHWIVFRLNGVLTPVFSIGFGKPFFEKKIGSTRFCLAPIFIGGYVRPLDQAYLDRFSDEEKTILRVTNPEYFDEKNWLQNKRSFVKMLGYSGGPLANLVFAAMLSFVLLLPVKQLPLPGPPTLSEVIPGSIAEAAGVKSGDILLQINGHPINDMREARLWIAQNLQSSAVTEFPILLRRGEETLKLNVHVPAPQTENQATPSKAPAIGVVMTPADQIEDPNVMQLGMAAVREVKDLFVLQGTTIAALFSGEISRRELSGPVGMVTSGSEFARQGLMSMLVYAMFLSIGLGWFNLLPIPMLDGFGILLSVFEMIRGKPVTPKVEFMLRVPGIVFLLALMCFALFNDIQKFFN